MNRRLFQVIVPAAALIIFVQAAMPAGAVLTKRYSFTSDGSDSLGSGLDWSSNGNLAFSDGQVHFDGVDDYLSLTSTPLPTSGSTTIEFWGTYDQETAVGSRVFDFASGSGNSFFYLTPRATPGTPQGNMFDPAIPGSNTRARWQNESLGLIEIGPMAQSPANSGEEVLFTLVFDHTVTGEFNGEFRLYRDAALVATASGFSQDILGGVSGVNDVRLGHGVSTPTAMPEMGVDPISDLPAFLTGSLNEFRIYDNVLTDLEILTNLISGPDVTSVSFNGKTWNNAGSADWNSGGNWTAPGVPAVGDQATIANGGTATVTSAVPQVGAMIISNGTLSVGSGGSLDVRYPIQLNTGASNTATINVTNGGVLSVGGILPDGEDGEKIINIDDGTIRPGFKSAFVSTGATAMIGAGGATFDTQGTDSLTWSSDLSGSGDVTKTGTGTIILRPSNPGAGLAEQNPDFSGEFFINNGTVDVQREHGVFGTAGSTQGGIVHMNDATLVINTANPIGLRKEFPADVVVTGDNLITNLVDRASTEIRMEGSISGDGTLEYIKPALVDALGLDFQHRANPTADPENPVLYNDNSGFTGRIVLNGNWAVRFFGTLEDPDGTPDSGDEVVVNTTDFPNAIVDLANAGAWMGKRGTAPNQTIRLGGVDGVANLTNPEAPVWSRLLSSIAGEGELVEPDPTNFPGVTYDFTDVTYEIGGASQDAVFDGRVTDVIGETFVDTVTVRKVGGNAQTFGGPNTYSGTTTIDGGTLLINGTHSRDALMLAGGETEIPAMAQPVGDYTVNAGGTLGGNGSIGSEADLVDVNVVGGAVNPGASVGTLTVEGGVSFDASSHFEVEILGSAADLLIADTLNVTSGATLDILPLGSVTAGDYVIAEFGSGSGMFTLNAPDGFSVSYSTPGQIILTAPNISAGLPGDYNGDNVVDAADYTVWRDNLGKPDESALNGNGDGANGVDQGDYDLWVSNFGESNLGSASFSNTSVPEPASLGLALLATAAMLGIRSRSG